MGLFRLLLIGALIYAGYRLFVSLSRALPSAGGTGPAPEPPAAKTASPRTPHEVLGVPPGATQREVRAAYQRLIQQYHPDRVAGLGPELRELAEQRTKELNAAYDALKER